MKIRYLSTAMMMAILVLGLFAGAAIAQEEDDPPEGVELDEVADTYILGEVIEREPPPAPEPEPEVEVLGVTEERLPVTGSDLLGIALIGLVLTGLGFAAVRRGRSRPTTEEG
jgi:LPXTG-motif cell wall-anchored protein